MIDVSFTVGNVEYKVPEIITLEMFQRASSWDIDNPKNLLPFVATVLNCPIEHLKLLQPTTFALITGTIIEAMKMDSKVTKGVKGHKIKDFDSLTFGEWIDIDVLFATGIRKNIVMVASILWGAETSIVKDWDIRSVWPVIQKLNEWRTLVYKQWDEFFEIEEVEEDEDAPRGPGNPGLQWYRAVLVLAGEDFLKIHQVVERPFQEALNYLTWHKAKVQQQKLEILKQKNAVQRSIR